MGDTTLRLSLMFLCCVIVPCGEPQARTLMTLETQSDKDYCINIGNDQYYELHYLEDQALWMGRTEVTIAFARQTVPPDIDYDYYCTISGYTSEWPIFNVTVSDAEKICDFLNRRVSGIPQGYEFRLPTCKEWLAAAVSSKSFEYLYGDSWPPSAMCDGYYPNLYGEDAAPADFIPGLYGHFPGIPQYKDGHFAWSPVSQSGANAKGFLGMIGNVEEWCLDDNTSDTWVIMGGGWTTVNRKLLRVNERTVIPVRPSILPGVDDRRSNNAVGLRLALAPKRKQGTSRKEERGLGFAQGGDGMQPRDTVGRAELAPSPRNQ